jgi:hypothetical protein
VRRDDGFQRPNPRPNVVVGDVVEYDGGGLCRFGRVESMQGPYWARVLLANGNMETLPTDSLKKCADDPIRSLAALSPTERAIILPAESVPPPPEGQPPGPEWLGGLLDAQ